jgi:hypothetical protein
MNFNIQFYTILNAFIFLNSENPWWNSVWEGGLSASLTSEHVAGGKSTAKIFFNEANVVFYWVVKQPPSHLWKDPIYAIFMRVNDDLHLGLPLLISPWVRGCKLLPLLAECGDLSAEHHSIWSDRNRWEIRLVLFKISSNDFCLVLKQRFSFS